MLRLGCRSSSLAVLLLLVSVATALAECSWVLWLQVGPCEGNLGTYEYHAMRAHLLQRRCETDKPQDFIAGKGSPDCKRLTHVCLPDTIDPRPPKDAAWVLWVGEWYDAGIGHPWSVLQAAATREVCLDALRRAAEAYKQKMRDVEIGHDARDPWALLVLGQGQSITIRCLPDTVDPRGPRTKQ